MSHGSEVVAAIRQSGITAVNYTISERDFEGTIKNFALMQALPEKYPDTFMIVRSHADISRAKRAKTLGIIPGFQYTAFLKRPRRIEMFRNLGVRIMQITYNNRSIFGDGCLEPGNAGLSKVGTLTVRKMNEIGVAVDLSHSGPRTTAEAIAASSKPVLISHAGCAAIYAHPRNKPDDILQIPGGSRRIFRCVSHALPGCLPDRADPRACDKSSSARHQHLRCRSCWNRFRWFDENSSSRRRKRPRSMPTLEAARNWVSALRRGSLSLLA